MKTITIETKVKCFCWEELSREDQELINSAIEATQCSYAPYSHFHVGAAVRLVNGVIITGSNQENAAFPSGLCAERTALFYANSRYPHLAVDTLAIAARTVEGVLSEYPISPCGACRQVMIETEKRYGRFMKVLFYGSKEIYAIDCAASLLPFSFDGELLK